MSENSENIEIDDSVGKIKKNKKKKKLSNLVSTFFRNALRSNLDLTSLADTKAGILISINGFILTVSVTASGFVVHNAIMTYAFISIILTSLGSIILAVLAVKPRTKNKLVKADHLEGYASLLYYQDMADLDPNEYVSQMNEALFSTKKSTKEMINHLHILGAEIKKKYFWLKQAYTFFSLGLIVSASMIIYALMYVEINTAKNMTDGGAVYKSEHFFNIFEPSGATTMPDGKILIVEDESSVNVLKLVELEEDNNVVEIGNLHMPKKIKKAFKKGIQDIEALTSDENTVFAATSHTLTKTSKQKKEREKLVMFTYEDESIKDFHTYGNLKKDLIASYPELFENTFFTANSINIEGLCFEKKSGNLLIGFRAPVIEGQAIVIGIENPREIFLNDEQPRFTKPITLNLNGMGIRDLTYDSKKEGYWIIAGGSNDRNGNFQLWFWDKNKAKVFPIKDQPDIGYGEGITVVNQDSEKPVLLIVKDNGKKPNKSAGYLIIEKDSL